MPHSSREEDELRALFSNTATPLPESGDSSAHDPAPVPVPVLPAPLRADLPAPATTAHRADTPDPRLTTRGAAAIVAAAIPTPVDPAFGPARAYVESHGRAWRTVFALDGGRTVQLVDPPFSFDRAGGKAARALARALNTRLGGNTR